MIIRKAELTRDLRPGMRGGEGTAQLDLVTVATALAPKCALCGNITLHAGDSIGYHEHQGECEIFQILQGEALVSDKGSETVLRVGDYFFTPSGSGHSIACYGDGPLVFSAMIIRD